jgi:hypothetical protein
MSMTFDVYTERAFESGAAKQSYKAELAGLQKSHVAIRLLTRLDSHLKK